MRKIKKKIKPEHDVGNGPIKVLERPFEYRKIELIEIFNRDH